MQIKWRITAFMTSCGVTGTHIAGETLVDQPYMRRVEDGFSMLSRRCSRLGLWRNFPKQCRPQRHGYAYNAAQPELGLTFTSGTILLGAQPIRPTLGASLVVGNATNVFFAVAPSQ